VQILGITVLAAGRQGKHALRIFQNERVAGLDNHIWAIFQRNRTGCMKGQQAGIAQFFWGNCPGD